MRANVFCRAYSLPALSEYAVVVAQQALEGADSRVSRQQSDVTARLILKLVDVAIQDALERGASQGQIRSLMAKRSGLRKCFFHAVNCW